MTCKQGNYFSALAELAGEYDESAGACFYMGANGVKNIYTLMPHAGTPAGEPKGIFIPIGFGGALYGDYGFIGH